MINVIKIIYAEDEREPAEPAVTSDVTGNYSYDSRQSICLF